MNRQVSRKAGNANLSHLASSMALPHEHKPTRFPIVPATHTALLDVMSDGTVPVSDNTQRRAFLCRDPCYPLWIERTLVNSAAYLESDGSATSWWIPNQQNRSLNLPTWDRLTAATSGTIDGSTATRAAVVDLAVLGDGPNGPSIFIPPASYFDIRVYTGATGVTSGLIAEIVYFMRGEEYTSTIVMAGLASGYEFIGKAGDPIPAGKGEGIIPVGFAWLTALRIAEGTAALATTPILQMGWSSGTSFADPVGTATVFTPYVMPMEYNNSTLPYSRTRVNASAALFTNVTAELSKEGTILAARAKPSVMDPWSFTTNTLNSVHPSLRYFGPLEKGLYTFTTPSGNTQDFLDCILEIPSHSTFAATTRPKFSFRDIGVYNAMVFSDLGSSSVGTQLAVSCYAHLEFETTSSLFSIGVSTAPLEALHATEVALLKFGHFHENPIHWQVLAAAVRNAMGYVAPMVAPYVKQLATHVIDRGVQYLRGKPAGDRSMPQRTMVEPPKHMTRKPRRAAVRGRSKTRTRHQRK